MASARTRLSRAGRRTAQGGGRAVAAAAGRLRNRPEDAPRPKPWESSVLDDLADSRPWNLLLKGTRLWALGRLRRDRPGVTVLVVNWQTGAETATTLAAVRRFSPPGTRILVVDNGSTDGSVERFRGLDQGLRVLRLPLNVGHAIALDLGTHLAGTELVVTLDSDAFPLGDRWLDPVVAPFADPAIVLAGSASKRGFVHPMYSCVRRREFLTRRLSWQLWSVRDPDTRAVIVGYDAGELMTPRLAPREVVLLESTPNRVEGLPGMTVADCVYHHGGVTRARQADLETSSWDRAVAALLPGDLDISPRHRPRE